MKFIQNISTFLRCGILVAFGCVSLAAVAAEMPAAVVRASNLAAGETCGPIALRADAPMDSLRFFDSAPTATSLLFGIGWPPEAAVAGNRLDLFHLPSLAPSNAAHFASAQIEPSWSNVVAEVPWQGDADLAFFRVADATDSDGDGLSDYEELWQYGTNPSEQDTDGDGLSDGEEVERGASPLRRDTDGDGLSDLDELGRVRKLTGCAFEEGGLLTNLTSVVRASLDNGGACVEWAFPAPVVVREKTYDRIAIDPNGVLYLRQPGMADAISRFACPDDFQQVLGRLEECVLMPYWAPLALSDTNPASAITVSACVDGYLVEFANMRFDAAAAAAAIGENSSLAAFLPTLLDRGWRVSFQVHIPSEGNVVSFTYETVEPTVLRKVNVNAGGVATNDMVDWLPSLVNGALSVGGIQLPNLGFTRILWLCSPNAVATGVKYVLTLGTGTDPKLAGSATTNDEVMVRFVMGDPSWTLSERYRMEVKPVSGPRGVTSIPPTHERVNVIRGVMEPFDVPLCKGWHYEVRLYHQDSSLGQGGDDYDYDYVFGCVPSSPRVIKEDPDGLFAANIRWRKTHDFGAEGLVAHLCVLGDPLLVPDYDRNRDIDDDDVEKAKNGEAFRFWVNDDNDSGDTNDSDNDRPGSGKNYADAKINGHCDILDFTPIWIDLSPVFPQDYIERFWSFMDWKLQSSCVNVVWTGLCRDEAGDFHIDDTRLVYGDDLMTGLLSNGTVCACSALPLSHALKAWMFNDANRGVFLIEGCKVGEGLSIVGKLQGTDAVVSNLLDLRVSSVEDMYRWMNSRGQLGEEVVLPSRLANPSNRPDEELSNRHLVFFHGANVTQDGARGWASEVFKRMWQSGLTARFTAVTWLSDKGADWNYQENVSNAFCTASNIVRQVGELPGTKVLMAHSLGNMVCSSMIQDYGLSVDCYLMCNSAVPAEAYDPDPSLRVPQLVHPEWEGYPEMSWASNWHWLFRNEPNDDRKELGWPGRFADVAQYAVNFYSTGDEVLELYGSNNIGVFTGVGRTNSWGHLSWHKQEIFKGRGGIGGTSWSGWNIEENFLGKDKISVEDAKKMAEADFRTNTVFYCYPSSMNQPTIPLLVRGAHLAQGIPALTPATGRVRFRSQIIGAGNNYDENQDDDEIGIARPNLWPVGGTYGESWCHSDMRDIAYFYVFKFYEKATEKGKLK